MNLGAVLRTAEAAGVHGVILPRHQAVGLTSAVARAGMGAMEWSLWPGKPILSRPWI